MWATRLQAAALVTGGGWLGLAGVLGWEAVRTRVAARLDDWALRRAGRALARGGVRIEVRS